MSDPSSAWPTRERLLDLVSGEPHPATSLMPFVCGAEYLGLLAHLRANGLQVPIVVDQFGKIIDGRARYRALSELSAEFEGDVPRNLRPRYQLAKIHDHEVAGLVISMNQVRRHLSESQRAMCAGRLRDFGKFTGHKTLDERAELFNVSASSVQAAQIVLDEGTVETIAMVDAGELKVSTARLQVRPRARKQNPEPPLEVTLERVDEASETSADEKVGATAQQRSVAAIEGRTVRSVTETDVVAEDSSTNDGPDEPRESSDDVEPENEIVGTDDAQVKSEHAEAIQAPRVAGTPAIVFNFDQWESLTRLCPDLASLEEMDAVLIDVRDELERVENDESGARLPRGHVRLRQKDEEVGSGSAGGGGDQK